jgi:hypothetical protein
MPPSWRVSTLLLCVHGFGRYCGAYCRSSMLSLWFVLQLARCPASAGKVLAQWAVWVILRSAQHTTTTTAAAATTTTNRRRRGGPVAEPPVRCSRKRMRARARAHHRYRARADKHVHTSGINVLINCQDSRAPPCARMARCPWGTLALEVLPGSEFLPRDPDSSRENAHGIAQSGLGCALPLGPRLPSAL